MAIIILSLIRIGCTLTHFVLDLLIEARLAISIKRQQLLFVSSLLFRVSLSLCKGVSFWSSISIISCYKHKIHLFFLICRIAFSTNMNIFSILFFLYLIISYVNSAPLLNTNGTSMYKNILEINFKNG